jgi:class 3 adenylate cyclase/tetratricopeptide (TPR) repeat protein
MPCDWCGFANADAARFCGGCGASLATECPSCAAPLRSGLRFCDSCGTQLGPAPSEPDPIAPGTRAERRRVSVLFVDLEDFTGIAESMDPEALRQVQSRYFESARAAVAAYDGTIEKFIGDAVMAVWGAPAAHEDDAERAVRAALAIVDSVSRLGGAASGLALRARAAVCTGGAAVTVGALGQGMVSGDLVNVAARLQSEAPTGGVLVDEPTRDLASGAATYEPVGSLTLKGRSAGIAAFRAIPRSRTDDARPAGAHSGAFVGRDGELRELIGLFEASVRERQCRLVSITGIAGIGKSRLGWELGEWIERLPDDVAWHTGQAPPYGEGITFAPLAEMVRRRIRVGAAEPPSVARRRLAATLSELVADEAERRWMEPRVAVLIERGDGEEFDREELFAAWRRFFERVADRTPVVLVFEDVQWADAALLDFIEHLAGWAREHPILVICLARVELLDRRPAWGTGTPRFTSIRLERLADADMRALLLGRAPDLSEGAVTSILARAGGVPLYGVEVVRVLSDGEPSPPVESLDVPDSLAGLISARIDAVPPAERLLLLSAAILGNRFEPGALVAITGTEPALIRERVEALARRDLLTLDEDPASPGHGAISFVQDLVRDVAAQTLAHADRRELHLAAARYLEAHDGEDIGEALARHLVEAHRLAPTHPDAARIARRAVAALRTAGRDALRLHVPSRALAHLEKALELAATPTERATVLEEAAAAARADARLDAAEAYLRELIELRGEGPESGRARAQLASVLLTAQRNEPALVELEAAVTAVADLASDPAGVEVISQLARARTLVGDDEAGLIWAERAIAAAEQLKLGSVAADARVTRGTALVRIGKVDEGMRELGRTIEDARRDGHLAVELRARNNLAWLAVADDPRTTLETAREGFDLAQTMGVGDMAVQLGEVACAAAVDTGDWPWALATTDALVATSIPEASRVALISNAAIIGAFAGDRRRVESLDAILPLPSETDAQVAAGVVTARAWTAFTAGRFNEAHDLATAAASESFGADRFQALALAVRAATWAGEPEKAAATLQVAEGTKLVGRATEATLASLRAAVSASRGDREPSGFEDAAAAWRRLDLPTQLAICLLDAERLADVETGELDQALRALGAHGLRALPAPSRASAHSGARTGTADRG